MAHYFKSQRSACANVLHRLDRGEKWCVSDCYAWIIIEGKHEIALKWPQNSKERQVTRKKSQRKSFISYWISFAYFELLYTNHYIPVQNSQLSVKLLDIVMKWQCSRLSSSLGNLSTDFLVISYVFSKNCLQRGEIRGKMDLLFIQGSK